MILFRRPAQKAKGRADVFAAISLIVLAAEVCLLLCFRQFFKGFKMSKYITKVKLPLRGESSAISSLCGATILNQLGKSESIIQKCLRRKHYSEVVNESWD